jgi:hypothetical protein
MVERDKTIIPHQIPASNPDRDRCSGKRQSHSAGQLCVDVEVRFAGVARIADLRDRVSNRQLLVYADTHRVFAKVAQQNVGIGAAQDHVVSRKVSAINLRHLHVGQSIENSDYLT